MEDKGGTRLWKADPPTKGSQKESRCTNKGSKKEYNGRHLETRPLGRRTCHPEREDKKGHDGRQRADTPSNKGKQEEAQWETRLHRKKENKRK